MNHGIRGDFRCGSLRDIVEVMCRTDLPCSLLLVSLASLFAFACSSPESSDRFTTFTTATPTTSGDGDGDGETTGDGDGDATTTGNEDCGDGVVQPGEQCDLGPENTDSGMCTTNCLIAACGDGLLYEGFEECDDGNSSNTDDCVKDCKIATCGDGFVHEGVEECDDANDDEADGCSSACTPGVCGDGVVQEGEQCDDANMDTSDECPACQLAYCGDGYVQAGVEECDDGNMLDNDECVSAFCVPAFCGDGYVQAGVEECDDGNMLDNDECPSCQVGFCGDGFVMDGAEECDDANMIDDDDCANDCTWNQCQPSGVRAPFDALNLNTASGCWDGNPCAYDAYSWTPTHGQNFQAFEQAISCTGAATCVANVGITTYSGGNNVCQGQWDVYCDGYLLGTIDTLGTSCSGSAMNNNCRISFPGRICSEIELRAAQDNNNTASCCGGSQPDTMITAVSAW
jgi:cysteine-rich repeat protein